MSFLILSICLLLVLAFLQTTTHAKLRAMSYGNPFGLNGKKEFVSIRSGKSLSRLHSLGIDYIAISVYSRQSSKTAADIKSDVDLDNIRYLIGHARILGMKTLLKPVVEVCCPRIWRGFIEPSKEWFAAYGKWIGDMAEFAQRESVDMFAVGSEFERMENDNSTAADWRKVVKDVRSKFKGELTYIVNKESHSRVTWWDAVDYISISAYYSLLKDNNTYAPSLEETLKLWKVKTDEFDQWRRNNGYGNKKVILAEMGYQSKGNGVGWRKSYDWTAEGPYDEDQQDTLYKAALEAWLSKEWVEGIFFWYWESDVNAGKTGLSRTDYTPQNKKAEKTLKNYYDKL